jgi:hypothetical protein
MEVDDLEHAFAMIQVLEHSSDVLIELVGILMLVPKYEDDQRRSIIVQLFEETLLSQKIYSVIVQLYFSFTICCTKLL